MVSTATVRCITIDTLLDGPLPKIRTARSQLRLTAKYHARAELIRGDHTLYFDLVNLHCRVRSRSFFLLEFNRRPRELISQSEQTRW